MKSRFVSRSRRRCLLRGRPSHCRNITTLTKRGLDVRLQGTFATFQNCGMGLYRTEWQLRRVGSWISLSDAVMVDKGFTFNSLVNEMCKCTFRVSGSRLKLRCQRKMGHIQEAASWRVERAIRRIKQFHFFGRPLPISMSEIADEAFQVRCFLSNFRMSLSPADQQQDTYVSFSGELQLDKQFIITSCLSLNSRILFLNTACRRLF